MMDITLIQKKAKVSTLNQLTQVSFADLIELNTTGVATERKILDNYRYFFAKTVEYLPERADAYELLGFCEYHLGRMDSAIAAYKQAIQLNKGSYLSYYNLGLIYLKSGKVDEAVPYLETIKRLDVDQAIKYITRPDVLYALIFKEPTADLSRIVFDLKNLHEQLSAKSDPQNLINNNLKAF